MLKRIAALMLFALALPALAHAQIAGSLGKVTFSPNVRATAASTLQLPAAEPPLIVSGFVGAVMDTPDDWFIVGGEGRLPIQDRTIDINPRFAYQPFEGGHTLQIDVNVVWEIPLANPGSLRPYGGVGGAFIQDTFAEESEGYVGLNLIGGVRFELQQSRISPYVTMQYTMVRDRSNPFAIGVGIGIPVWPAHRLAAHCRGGRC
jgi:hypothetical protein